VIDEIARMPWQCYTGCWAAACAPWCTMPDVVVRVTLVGVALGVAVGIISRMRRGDNE